MYCPNCGSEVPEGALFCAECGHEIKDAPEEASQKSVQRKPSRRLVIAVVAAVVVALAVLAWALLRGGTDAEAKIMASMREANGGVDPELSYDGDELVSIEGRFSSVRVAGRADALSAFGEVAPLFGIYRPTEELEFDREEEGPRPGATTYVFAVVPDPEDEAGAADAPAGRREVAVTADGSGDVSRVERRRAEEPEAAEELEEDVELSAQAKTVSLLLPTHVEMEMIGGVDIIDASYDESGRMVRKECRPSDGNEYARPNEFSNGLYYATYEYRYDGLGRLEGVDITDSVAFDGTYDGTWDIGYSDDGSSMEAEFRRAGGDGVDGRIRESYDGAGNLLCREYQMPRQQSKTTEMPTTFAATETYQYSSDGLIDEIAIEYDEDSIGIESGEVSKITYSFSYTGSGQMETIKENGYLSSGELGYEYTYKVDEFGNVISRDGGSSYPYTEYYTYSESGVPKEYSVTDGYGAFGPSIEQESDVSYRYYDDGVNGLIEYENVECRADRAPLVLASTIEPVMPQLASDLWVGCLTIWGSSAHVLPQVLIQYRIDSIASGLMQGEPDNVAVTEEATPTVEVPEGYSLLSGTVTVYDQEIPTHMYDGSGSVTMAVLLLDEPVDFEWERKGYIEQVTASDVQLANSASDSFGEWASYDGKHITVACEFLVPAYRDASYLGVDALANGDLFVVETN